MANYVLLYFKGEGGVTKEDMADMGEEVMQAWAKWYEELGSSVVDPGSPFAPQTGMYVEDDGVGPIGNNWPATGYTIVKADSMDDAVKMAQSNPMMQQKGGFSVRVFEAMPM